MVEQGKPAEEKPVQVDTHVVTLEELQKKSMLQISVEKFDDYILVNLINVFNFESAKYFQMFIAKNVVDPYLVSHSTFILSMKQMGSIDKTCLREIVQFHLTLKKQNKKLFIVEVNKEVSKTFLTNGLDSTFVLKGSAREVLIEVGVIKKKTFDVNFLNPFIEGVVKMMEIQCFTKVTPGTLTVLKPNEFPPVDICGTIGIVSETFTGTIMMHFKKDVYIKVGGKMLSDENFNDKSEAFLDAVGEMANIILGQAKIKLNQLGYNIQQALPSVTYGKDQMTKTISPSPSILIPFTSEFGMFHMQITTKLQ